MPLASLAQLEQSHRRHDDVMENLVTAARRLAAGRPDTFDIDRINDAVEYFKRSVTRNFLDEEGSVFPRLSTRRPELAEQLASLSADHPTQVKLQERIGELAAHLDGESRQGAHKELLEAANRLAEVHRTHGTRLEHVFTIAEAALTAQDDADIVSEMETRRDRQSSDTIPISKRQRSETIAARPAALRKHVAPVKKQTKAAKTATKKTAPAVKKKKKAPVAAKPKPKPKPKKPAAKKNRR